MLKFVVEDLRVCVNSKNHIYEETPIFETISEGRLHEAAYLLKKGANVNIQNKKKETPLHYAVSSGKIKMIELFLKNGADINIKDEKGLTPVDYAEKENNARVVKLLKIYSK
jgi:ankyrin repeat protein